MSSLIKGNRKGNALIYFAVPLVLAAAITGSVIAVRAQGGGNPEAGLTDAQREANHRAGMATSVAMYHEAAATYVAGGLDISTLRRAESLAKHEPSTLTLADATARAVLIVRGTVTAQRLAYCGAAPPDLPCAMSTIRISSRLKGEYSLPEVILSQPALVSPGSSPPTLVVEANDPVVTLGAEVIVFVEKFDPGGRALALSYKVLTVADGKVIPNRLDRPLAGIGGATVDTVVQEITRDVAAAKAVVTRVATP